MPYLNKIVECINDDLKSSTIKGIPLQAANLGGITTLVSFTSTNDDATITLTKPVEFKDGKEINHLPNDLYPMQVYHRINSLTYSKDTNYDFGDGGQTIKETAGMTMYVFADYFRVNMTMDELAHRIMVGFPTIIQPERVCKEDIKNVLLSVQSVNVDREQLFKGETALGEYGLKPQSIYMALAYTIETVSLKNCYSCN